jgi:hypothetical protein
MPPHVVSVVARGLELHRSRERLGVVHTEVLLDQRNSVVGAVELALLIVGGFDSDAHLLIDVLG